MTDLFARLAQALGGTYRIERELGGGGMSHVFLADEVALGRRVVIKVLPPDMAAGVSEDRFRREIQLAARLQHPHIVPLLSTGSADGLLYYVMPFVEGESLRVKLAREGELPVAEAARILREVSDALAYAHEQGVVHRDIKPDNVLLSRGHAVVADFGVARAIERSGLRGPRSESSPLGTSDLGPLTSLGVALGTPAYMAPEQASADPHVDHRADIYSLGALGYEMLAGRPPFVGANPQALLVAHLTQAPDKLSAYRAAVPPALEHIVMRCLEKHAADRWQTAGELLPALDALTSTAAQSASSLATPSISSGTEAALRRSHPVRVAGAFTIASLVVLTAMWWLVQRLGLPGWVMPVTIALLVIGLPIMLITARRERALLVARTTGQHAASRGGLAARLFTWRGALTGGGVAFGGLVVGTTLFMGLRILGIGPFATLVSAGVLEARDPLVLTDFVNRTSDSTLGTSITEALRIDLTRSPVLRLVETNQVAATLRLMQKNPATRLTEGEAREVAQRVGAKAVVTGEITPLGSGYVLTSRLVSAADSSTLVAERETAADAGALIPAVERLSKKLRERIGESLRTIRGAQPLEQVTTSSLAALRAYSEGSRLFSQNRGREATQLFTQAVSLDSTFGMAWRRIGVALWNAGVDRPRMVDALTRAYNLRDRMPPQEAAHAAAFYFNAVEHDRPKATAAYEQLLASWPDDLIAINNLAVYYYDAGRDADAEHLMRRAVAARPDVATYNGNLVENLVKQGKFLATDSALNAWGRNSPTNASRMLFASRVAREKNDFTRALTIADSMKAAEGADAPIGSALQRAEILRYQGRFSAAERETRTAMSLVVNTPLKARYVPLAADIAYAQAFVLGHADAAIREIESAIAQYPLDSMPPGIRPYGNLIRVYVMASRLDRARAVYADYEKSVPREIRDADGNALSARGLLSLNSGDARSALTDFRRWGAADRCVLCSAFAEAQAFERMSQKDSAIAAYERYANGHALTAEGRAFNLAAALRRLGELYESQGAKDKAIEYYTRFVDLWKDADPELQPLVKDVRRHVADLAGEPTHKQDS